MKWTQERQLLLGSEWFKPLPDAVVDQLAAMTRRRKLQDGEHLFSRGDAPDGLYCVVKGSIRSFSTSASGRQHLLYQFEAGAWFGEISMFDGMGRTHDGAAVGDTEVLILPRDRFLALLSDTPALYPHFLSMLCRKLRLAFAYIEDVQFEPLSVRLARRLLDLVSLYGCDSPDGQLINITLPQDDLAQMLGASRQAISKLLKHWESFGWLRLEYRKLVVCDLNAFQTIADGEPEPRQQET